MKSAICVPGFGLSRPDGSSGSLREAVLAGPGARVQVAGGSDPVTAVVTAGAVTAALTAAGHTDKQQATLSGAVTTVLVLGLCLFSGQGYAGVITRLWPLLSVFNPPSPRPEFTADDPTVASAPYQQILHVLSTAPAGMRAKDICLALGVAASPKHVEGTRAKLKRMVNREILTETEPGIFTLAPKRALRPCAQ